MQSVKLITSSNQPFALGFSLMAYLTRADNYIGKTGYHAGTGRGVYESGGEFNGGN